MLRERKLDLRDHIKGLRLDRNEKVNNWPKSIFQKIIKNRKDYIFSIHPDLNNLYKKISKLENISKKNFIITSGIDGAIHQVFENFTKPKDNIIKLNPTWQMYDVYSKVFKTNSLNLDFDNSLKLNIKSLSNLLKKKPKIIFLSYPNSPIEGNLDENLIKKIISLVPRKCIIVIDEVYFGFGSKSFIKFALNKKNIIVTRSFSKTFGLPSIRLGYLISNKKIIKKITETRLAYETNTFSAVIAEYFLNNLNIIKKFQKEIIYSRVWLNNELAKLNIQSYSKFSYGILINFESNKLLKFKKMLKDKKIYVKILKKPHQNFILITLGPKKIMKKFLDIIKIFKKKYD